VSSKDGATLYVSDRANHAIRVVDVGTARMQTLAGTPTVAGYRDGADALFNNPTGITIADDRATIFVVEWGSTYLRAIDASGGAVRTLFSLSGAGGNQLTLPPGGAIFLTDTRNRVLAANLTTGVVTILLGGGGNGLASGARDGIGTFFREPDD